MSNEKIEETKIEYILKGDYYVPNLYLPEENYQTKGKSIGKYGRARLNHLKRYNCIFYTELVLENKLHEYLVEVNEEANNKIALLVNKMMIKEGITEELKSANQLAWVGAMNNIKNRAEELVLKEIIYV